jgi:hypothetical protein
MSKRPKRNGPTWQIGALRRLSERYGRNDEIIRRNLKKRGVRMRAPWERL